MYGMWAKNCKIPLQIQHIQAIKSMLSFEIFKDISHKNFFSYMYTVGMDSQKWKY